MSVFETKSSPKRNVTTVLLVCGIVAILALLGLMISLAACIFFEIMIIISSLVCLLIVKRTYWGLAFQDHVLFLRNMGNGQGYVFEDLKRSDFVFKQTDRQEEQNRGDLKIADFAFAIYDVENFRELKRYIESNFA